MRRMLVFSFDWFLVRAIYEFTKFIKEMSISRVFIFSFLFAMKSTQKIHSNGFGIGFDSIEKRSIQMKNACAEQKRAIIVICDTLEILFTHIGHPNQRPSASLRQLITHTIRLCVSLHISSANIKSLIANHH